MLKRPLLIWNFVELSFLPKLKLSHLCLLYFIFILYLLKCKISFFLPISREGEEKALSLKFAYKVGGEEGRKVAAAALTLALCLGCAQSQTYSSLLPPPLLAFCGFCPLPSLTTRCSLVLDQAEFHSGYGVHGNSAC